MPSSTRVNARLDAGVPRLQSCVVNEAYRQTVFLVEASEVAWPEEFAVITACNPDGRTVGERENAARTGLMLEHLSARGAVVARVEGCSPDLVHCEPGFAARLSLQEAVTLGRQFEQEAVFHVRAGVLSLVSCEDGRSVVLGAWRDRLARRP